MLRAKLFIVTLVLTILVNPLYPNIADAAPRSFAPIVKDLIPAVVNISTSQKIKRPRSPFGFGGRGGLFPFPDLPPGREFDEFREFFERFGGGGFGLEGEEPLEQEVHSLGSGFIIDPDGYVVTNNHVVAKAEEITVILHDDTKLEAKIIGRDPKTDLALLKVEHNKKLPFVKFGDSDKARVGDWVIAIGNPFGLGSTVSAGIISARSRNINSGPFDDFLQTDAAINRGNSGGPMFNVDGEVIGVNTAIYSPSGGNVGIGFSIPSALAKPVLEQLRKYGRTHRGWLGVKIQHITEEIADSLGLDKPVGALVLGVNKDGPAVKAGIKAGDVILSFDGKKVKEMRQLPRIVAETKIGKTVPVVIWRDGKKKKIFVTLGELDEGVDVAGGSGSAEAEKGSSGDDEVQDEIILGMTLRKLDSELKKRLQQPRDKDKQVDAGIVVMDVDRKSEAAKRGIHRGDVIVAVGQKEVSSISELKKALKAVERAGRKYVLLRIARAGEMSFITLPLDDE